MQKQLQLARGGDSVATIVTRAGRLAYWTKGTGAPVLLIHGNSAGKEGFAPQLKFLTGAGYRAVASAAIRLRAFGDTNGGIFA